ncbi:MAG TPA: aldose 1-epimerase [Hyphomonas sp.]|nr:aldose 1-epimerase [Hyphomonas sp.]
MDVVIERNGFRLVLMPELGGSVRSFTWNGQDILRPALEPTPASLLDTAAFPLFPFSGRIDHGRFSWNGREVQLRANFPPEPHAIHGQAWLAPWSVEEIHPAAVSLAYLHAPGHWPWEYRAIQRFELLDNGLKLGMELTNLSDEDMPSGLGWHPYFPRGDAELSANVSDIWVAESGMIPDRRAPLGTGTDIRSVRKVDELDLDNAFTARPANADIVWPATETFVSITSSPELGHLVVYVPSGRDFFCVEPVSHSPDAINSLHETSVTGLRVLTPGETLSASIILEIGKKA